VGDEHLDPEMWVKLSEAPDVVHRSKQTIYRWVSEGHIATMRPTAETWLFLPDLWKTANQMRRLGKKYVNRG
jgi:maltose-binding protein MalE